MSDPEIVMEETPEPQNAFRLLSKQAFLELIGLLKLSRRQAVSLEEVLREVEADLQIWRGSGEGSPERAEKIAKLRKMLKLATALCDWVRLHGAELLDFMPHKGLENMAAQLTFSAITEARRRNAFPADFHADVEAIEKARGRPPTLQDIEAFYETKRANFGLTDPAALLTHFLDTLIEQMQMLLDVNRHNPGGRPTFSERRYLIQRLALAAPQILGEPATTSLTGRFVDLCEQVAVRCGLMADGMDKAAAAVVRELAGRSRLEPF
jgi:hypothetical protein